MDGWMDGRMDGWMDGWMDEWTNDDKKQINELVAYTHDNVAC